MFRKRCADVPISAALRTFQPPFQDFYGASAESKFIDKRTTHRPMQQRRRAMKFIPERFDQGLASLVYVAVCAGCTGCVLYVVAALAAAGL